MPVDMPHENGIGPVSDDPMLNDLMDRHIHNVNGVITTGRQQNGHQNGNSAQTDDDDDSEHPPPFKMPRAPPHVYSCFVINRTNHPIECDIHYAGRPQENTFDEDVHVVIPPREEKYFPRKIFQPDLPDSYCRWVKIITQIRAKKHDGRVVETNYPFENVYGPIRNWEFHVKDEGEILSKPPTRPANILKYENLDEYER